MVRFRANGVRHVTDNRISARSAGSDNTLGSAMGNDSAHRRQQDENSCMIAQCVRRSRPHGQAPDVSHGSFLFVSWMEHTTPGSNCGIRPTQTRAMPTKKMILEDLFFTSDRKHSTRPHVRLVG